MSALFGGGVNTTTVADKIAAFQSTTCDFGTPLPICYGTCKRAPNLINFQDFTPKAIAHTQKTGKDSSSTTINYQYYVYAELALCEGVIDGINKIWIGDEEYNSLAALNAKASNQGAPLSLNPGNNSNPTTYMATKHPDIAVGYANMAYLYGYIFLGENSASIPSYQFEIAGLLRASGDYVDANPADVIIDLLTRVGYGSYIDADSFEDFRSYCRGFDLLISTPQKAFTQQKKCQEVVKELLNLTNAYMFWSVDRFKIVPRDDRKRGSWNPNTTIRYSLTPDEMMPQDGGACVLFERKDSSAVFNRFGVAFTNRENNYEEETVFFEDTADIALRGPKTANDFPGQWLHTAERAVKVAEMQARINRTENIRYKFKVSWEFGLLEPGDLITLTDPVVGLDHQLAMVDSVDEDSSTLLSITAVRREASAQDLTYDIPARTYNIVTYSADPGDVRPPLMIIPPEDLITSSSGLEVLIALQGDNVDWGGCDVYASTKDGAYTYYGKQNRSSNFGYILGAVSAADTSIDVHFTNVNTVSILEGSAQDAADCLTDFWVNGECMAYTGSTLIGPNEYRLTGLIRGKYGTTAAAHSVNDGFALLDGSLFCIQITRQFLGRTLYLKFPSFNTFGNSGQDINDLNYYNHLIRTYDIPNVAGLSATSVRHTHTDVDPDSGETRTWYTWDVTVRWTAPDYDGYNSGRVSYKRSGANPWTYAGIASNTLTVYDIATAGTYVFAVSTRDVHGNYETEDDSAQVSITLSTT